MGSSFFYACPGKRKKEEDLIDAKRGRLETKREAKDATLINHYLNRKKRREGHFRCPSTVTKKS